MTDQTTVEKTLQDAVDPGRLGAHLEAFNPLFRDSGTEDERRAAEYIKEQMDRLGIESAIHEFESLISLPGPGELALLDADGTPVEEITVRTRSFGAQTPDGGLEAELVYVPFEQPGEGEMIFTHRAKAADYTGLTVEGKVVITMDGGPDGIRRAEERGAAGHIHIWPSDEHVVHEMIATSVWG
ncbi:MAG: hypothetical protein ACOC9Y_05685, partial [Chloroflexota bacterium]